MHQPSNKFIREDVIESTGSILRRGPQIDSVSLVANITTVNIVIRSQLDVTSPLVTLKRWSAREN